MIPNLHPCSFLSGDYDEPYGFFTFFFMVSGGEVHQISYFLLNDRCLIIMSEENSILGERESHLKRIWYLIAAFFLFEILIHSQCHDSAIYLHAVIFLIALHFSVGGLLNKRNSKLESTL